MRSLLALALTAVTVSAQDPLPRRPQPRVVTDALPFVQAIQAEDGRFPARPDGRKPRPDEDLRATAWVCLGLLADGAAPDMAALDGGLRWLLRQQDARGRIGLRTDPAWIVDHALATEALAEADSRSDDAELASGVRRAVAFLGEHLARVEPGTVDPETLLWSEAAARAIRGDGASRLRAEARRHRTASAPLEAPARTLVVDCLFGELLGEPMAAAQRERVRAAVVGDADAVVTFLGMVALFRDGSEPGRAAFGDASRALTATVVMRQQPNGSWAAPPGGDETTTTAARVLALTVYYRYCGLGLATGAGGS